ncbi:MAG TPA: KTSC domain-containing protein [Chitinophagaceae bacterium]|jgi:KTSC domain-containing protein|nr:KTSC domain-containing protein [Chitinophagaceae bacterium]
MPSSVVAEIRYDKLSHTLRVVYVSGMIYDYKDVPEEIYAAMNAAFSKGTFLNKYIKGRYEFEKVGK